MAGTLYLVATPIGNLEDITYRAVRILGEVEIVACEDTRQTRKLLSHLGIRKSLESYHEHNEVAKAAKLVKKLEQGADVALVSDAGTPLVSDPGYRLVRQALEHGIPVTPIPGPSAAVTALMAAGLPSDSFHFAGFLPVKAAQRRKALERIRELSTTVVIYEAPHRVLKTLDDLRKVLRDRPIVVARELTKLHEEFLRGSAAGIHEILAGRDRIRGEFTIVIGREEESGAIAPEPEQVRAAVTGYLQRGVPRMEAMKSAAREFGIPKRAVYQIMEDSPADGDS